MHRKVINELCNISMDLGFCYSLVRMHLRCSYILILVLVVFVCAYGKPNSDDFINIDSGITSNTSYVDSFTGLLYVSDDQYIDTGLNGKISSQYPVNKNMYTDLETLRSFPNGTRNCYTIKPVTQGSKYLVRATFYYGNYDKSDNLPKFDLYFGVNFWCTIDMSRPDYWYAYEIIGIAPANYIQVCLVNTGQGTPFISVLEVRPLNSTIYELANSTQSLNLFARMDVGSNNIIVRYPDDSHDRIWFNYTQSSWKGISTSSSIDGFEFDVPSLVLQTAAVSSTTSSSMDLIWSTTDTSTIFLVVLHFSEIQILQNTSLREFYVYAQGKQMFEDPVPINTYLNPAYAFYTDTGYTEYNVSLKSTARATLPPILNAFELYTILQVTLLPTDNGDVVSINSIKASYSIKKDWSGDPCLPRSMSWTGVNCTISSSNIPRITTLNLSSSGLTRAMVSAFGYLTELETLDLSHNNLSGDIPSSLDQLTSLKFMNLSGNNGLSRTLPPGLQKKLKDRHLRVIFDDTPVESQHKKLSIAVIYVIVAAIIVLVIVGAVALLLYLKKKTNTRINPPMCDDNSGTLSTPSSTHLFVETKEPSGEWRPSNFNIKQFSYAELNLITSNFSEKLGVGGFGEVFKGRLNDETEVAVKVSSKSSQGTEQFLKEVEILSKVHHKNLVSLIGYCKEGNHIALVYEYMQGGNVQDWLKGNVRSLSWRRRLQIAYESAQGLEYLHKMCNPPLIHRDVKTSNILLTKNLEARVSDFGLARSCVDTTSTRVMGTPGYLDPFYASTFQVSQKIDVYSFGVVLLELITGKQPIGRGLPTGQHLTQFVKRMLSNGNIESILDPNMGKPNNLSSVWKVADDLAVRCTSHPDKRPDMTEIVRELKEILNLEMSSSGTCSVASGNITEYSGYSRNDSHATGSVPSGEFEMTPLWGNQLPDYGPMPR